MDKRFDDDVYEWINYDGPAPELLPAPTAAEVVSALLREIYSQ